MLFRPLSLYVCALCVLHATLVTAGQPELLRIGDGSGWTFHNGAWEDRPEDRLVFVDSSDGPAMQGHHYAFFKEKAYRDFRATFEIQLTGHSDVGLIFRAASPREFSMLLFPNIGQASRAQHFWMALGRMDPDGYLRMSKLDMINRVSSSRGVWLPVEVEIQGRQVRARIGESGIFEAQTRDDAVTGPGRVGVFLYSGAQIRKLKIEGAPVADVPWDETLQPRKNWFLPVDDDNYGRWQRPKDLVRTPSGDLLLSFLVQETPFGSPLHPTSPGLTTMAVLGPNRIRRHTWASLSMAQETSGSGAGFTSFLTASYGCSGRQTGMDTRFVKPWMTVGHGRTQRRSSWGRYLTV